MAENAPLLEAFQADVIQVPPEAKLSAEFRMGAQAKTVAEIRAAAIEFFRRAVAEELHPEAARRAKKPAPRGLQAQLKCLQESLDRPAQGS